MRSAVRSSARLIADSMLGDVARKLRLYGLDVLYYKQGDDEGLLRNYRDRVLLTGDEELYRRAVAEGRSAILVKVGGDKARVVAGVLRELGVRPSLALNRCTVCNGRLRRAGPEDLRGVPEAVRASRREFYVCESCGKVYWIGGHWRGIREFSRRVKEELRLK